MALLRMPEPYDFELSTERYRAFGPDLANLWHEGALHRVVDGREVRIARPPGRVDVEPLDAAIEPVVRKLLGASSISTPSTGSPRATRHSRRSSTSFAACGPRSRSSRSRASSPRSRPSRSRCYAAFAIRNRLIERFGVRAEHAYAFPTRERMAGAEPDELTALGFSRRKAEYAVGLARSDLDLARPRRPARRRGQGHADRAAGDRRVDRRLVPRPPPRAASSLACRRPRRPEGGLPLLRRGPGSLDRRGARRWASASPRSRT